MFLLWLSVVRFQLEPAAVKPNVEAGNSAAVSLLTLSPLYLSCYASLACASDSNLQRPRRVDNKRLTLGGFKPEISWQRGQVHVYQCVLSARQVGSAQGFIGFRFNQETGSRGRATQWTYHRSMGGGGRLWEGGEEVVMRSTCRLR